MCLSAAIGVAFAGNLLTLLIFYEILTIATWPLVIHHEDESAIKGGRKYLVYTLTAGCLLLLAIAITYSPGRSILPAADFSPVTAHLDY